MREIDPREIGPQFDRRNRVRHKTWEGSRMAFMNWQPDFSVGSPALDDQHKGLIELINELHTATLRGQVRTEMQRIFGELIQYTETHFSCEEGLMRQTSYPRYLAHRVQHVQFVHKLQELFVQAKAMKFTVSMDLLLFLKTWLSEHILGTDQELAPHLKAARGADPEPVAKFL
jgi:hemerythrin